MEYINGSNFIMSEGFLFEQDRGWVSKVRLYVRGGMGLLLSMQTFGEQGAWQMGVAALGLVALVLIFLGFLKAIWWVLMSVWDSFFELEDDDQYLVQAEERSKKED